MFGWFTSSAKHGSAGLKKMRDDFSEMLDASRRAFDMAATVFLEGGDPDVIREELFAIDKGINRTERQIRKKLVVHASVHPAIDVPSCLVLMSIVKDAERVGDYAKNLFDLATLAPHAPEGEYVERLGELRRRIVILMIACRAVVDANRKREARKLIVDAKKIEDICDDEVRKLVCGTGLSEMAPAYVLAFRYFKRVTSHFRNVTSSVVQPVHKLDFTSKIAEDDPSTEPDEAPNSDASASD